MKAWMKPTKLEWITLVVLMPVLALALKYWLFCERIWHEKNIWLYSFPIVCLQGIASWYLHILAMHWMRVEFPSLKQTSKRLVLVGITHVALTSLTFASLFYGYDAIHFLGYHIAVEKFKMSVLLALALTLVATSTWEAEYVIKQWKQSLAAKEQMQQLAIEQEFEALKSQVNPHFLFNCFNTLSSLISEEPEQAEKFLDELSKVYRYLLRNNESGLSTLKNELQFIRSYFELLKTRHGNAIQFQIETDKRYDHYLLPSLSLQLLVENAVKHNTLSKEQPLFIEIFTMAGNKLAVNNNLQRKTQNVLSNKVGLQNIRMKYELLKESGFQVMEENRNYTVVLPLIWNHAMNSSVSVIRNHGNIESYE